MIFKDRKEAGEKLSELLKKDRFLIRNKKKIVVVSLLRGGIIVGNVISKSLKTKHLALAVAKIGAPGNPELALGALCFDVAYLEPKIVSSLNLDKVTIQKQIGAAREKFKGYQQRFSLKEKKFNRLNNQTVILVDDGIATGSSMKAALLFVKSKKPKKIILAVPVAPTDFDGRGFYKIFILHKDPFLASVSQFYESFPQIEDEEVKRMLY